MNHYDKVYMSKVFPGSADVDSVIYADEIERGGTGYFYPDGGPPLLEEIEQYSRTMVYIQRRRGGPMDS